MGQEKRLVIKLYLAFGEVPEVGFGYVERSVFAGSDFDDAGHSAVGADADLFRENRDQGDQGVMFYVVDASFGAAGVVFCEAVGGSGFVHQGCSVPVSKSLQRVFESFLISIHVLTSDRYYNERNGIGVKFRLNIGAKSFALEMHEKRKFRWPFIGGLPEEGRLDG